MNNATNAPNAPKSITTPPEPETYRTGIWNNELGCFYRNDIKGVKQVSYKEEIIKKIKYTGKKWIINKNETDINNFNTIKGLGELFESLDNCIINQIYKELFYISIKKSCVVNRIRDIGLYILEDYKETFEYEEDIYEDEELNEDIFEEVYYPVEQITRIIWKNGTMNNNGPQRYERPFNENLHSIKHYPKENEYFYKLKNVCYEIRESVKPSVDDKWLYYLEAYERTHYINNPPRNIDYEDIYVYINKRRAEKIKKKINISEFELRKIKGRTKIIQEQRKQKELEIINYYMTLSYIDNYYYWNEYLTCNYSVAFHQDLEGFHKELDNTIYNTGKILARISKMKYTKRFYKLYNIYFNQI